MQVGCCARCTKPIRGLWEKIGRFIYCADCAKGVNSEKEKTECPTTLSSK